MNMTMIIDDELLDALAPSTGRIQAMLDSNDYNEDEKRAKVHSAFIHAVTAGQLEILEWLLQTQTGSSSKQEECKTARLDINATDDNGTPAIVLAAVFGHGEAVRLLLEYGADIDAADSRGWTALFWAFQRGDLTMSSFLINRKAKTSIKSNNGLSATDLIRKGSIGEVLGKILQESDLSTSSLSNQSTTIDEDHVPEDAKGTRNRNNHAHSLKQEKTSMIPFDTTSGLLPSAGPSSTPIKHSSLPTPTSATMRMRSASIQMESRRRAFLDSAAEACRTLDIDIDLLDLESNEDTAIYDSTCLSQAEMFRSSNTRAEVEKGEEEEEGKGEEENDSNSSSSSLMSIFNWKECLNTQMLSFSMEELPALLDLSISEIKPSRRSKNTRGFPANIIFLACRFASRFGGEDLLGELLLGAIERIEISINTSPENLANSAFWLSNCVLLLYYLRKDPQTQQTTLEYQDNIYDTIGRIFLYCIRDVERRLDKVLDSAMLDHEALPGYSDIRFEGEWRFVKALTNRSKKDTFGSVNGSPSSRPSVLGLFGSPDRGAQQQQQQQQQQAESPFHTPSHKNTPQDPVSAGRMRTPSMPAVLRGSMFSSPSTSSQQPPPQIQEEPSPKSVTTILSSTLFILQHYDYAGHPAIIVQAFSQLLYWIASELFNRILTRKRYLCRSKAVQIRLNVSALEEWARTNKLPPMMVQAHFRPLNELLQWLQCLSSETSIDGLLVTMQNLKSLNPAQLQKAVKDYKHEVEETKIAEECTQYLSQLQKDWERRRMLQGLDAAQQLARVSSSSSSAASYDSNQTGTSISLRLNESSRTSDMRSDAERHIDDIFGDPTAANFDGFVPTVRRENVSELFESRLTLPFSLPTANEALLMSPRTYFGNISSALHRPLDMQVRTSRRTRDDINIRPFIIDDPEPYIPEGFFEQLSEVTKLYEGVMPVRRDAALQASKRRRSNLLTAPGGGIYRQQGDHWLNWRERLAIELDDCEEKG